MFDDQARHVAYIIDEVGKRGSRVAEVTPEAEAEWVAEIQRLSFANRDFYEACTPGYYNNEGQLDDPEQGHHPSCLLARDQRLQRAARGVARAGGSRRVRTALTRSSRRRTRREPRIVR